MSIIERMLKQICVYWAPIGTDNYGNPTFASPVELACRWEAATEEFLSFMGERELSNALVYVESDVKPRGVLMLGELTDITDSVSIKENDNAWEIRRFDSTPTLKATKFLREAYL